MTNAEERIKTGQATLVDVRTRSEFMGGHVAGSINIPLQELPSHLEELKAMPELVLCCASGSRSQQAAAYLTQHGIACSNGGSWMDVNAVI